MKTQSKKIHIDFELEEFIEELHYEVDARTYAEGDGAFKEDVFTEYMLELLADSGDTEGQMICNYSKLNERGNLEVKVNAYALKENYETLDLFITLYRDTKSLFHLTKSELESLVKLVSRFAANALKGYSDTIDPSHQAFSLSKDISKHYKVFDRINLFVFTNGDVPYDPPEDHEIKGMEEIAVMIHVWDIERIYRLVKSKSGREPIEIDFEGLFGVSIPCLKMPVENKVYECYLAIMPGRILSLLYRNFSTRLLESNVRAFLQQTGSVNKGIKDTILKKPFMFLPYNNGLAVTAQDVKTKVEEGQLVITEIKDLQIVNGGQTTASLFHTEKRNKANLSEVYVQVKLTVIRDEDMKVKEVPNISRFANSQNKVSELDLTSNNPYLQRLEELSRTTYAVDPANPNRQTLWFFERVKGQYREMINKESKKSNQDAWKLKYPSSQVFTKSDIAKYLNIWEQLPHTVSKGAQKNYTAFLDRIQKEFSKKMPTKTYYEDLIANAILFNETDQLFGRKNKNAIGDTNLKSFTVAYTLSYFHYLTDNMLNLQRIWELQSMPGELKLFFGDLMQKIYAFMVADSQVLISEVAKSEKFWNSLKEADIYLNTEEIEQFLFTEAKYDERYSENIDSLKEVKHYNDLQKITNAGIRFWDALPKWLLTRDDFSTSKKSFADSIRKKIKSTGQLSETEVKHGVEILDKLEELGISIEKIKATSKLVEDKLIDTSSIYTRICNISEDNWKRIIALGEQKKVLEFREISVVKSVSRKIKTKEPIDIKTLSIMKDVLEKVKKFGIKG
jgi:hypothetical protein